MKKIGLSCLPIRKISIIKMKETDANLMYKLNSCQDGRVAMLPAATRNYVSSILTPDLDDILKKE